MMVALKVKHMHLITNKQNLVQPLKRFRSPTKQQSSTASHAISIEKLTRKKGLERPVARFE